MRQHPALPETPVQKVTLVEAVMEQIIALIRQGHLKPGGRLPSEHELMQMMHVGRSTVREAMQALAGMNLVEIRSGRGGSLVKNIPRRVFNGNPNESIAIALEKDMRVQLWEMRQVNEEAIARWTIQRASAEELGLLKAAMANLNEYSAHHDCPGCWRSHEELHLLMAQISHNSVAERVLGLLFDTMPQSLWEKYPCEGWCQDVRAVHQQVCDAVCMRDEVGMHDALHKHVEQGLRHIDASNG